MKGLSGATMGSGLVYLLLVFVQLAAGVDISKLRLGARPQTAR